MNYAEKTAQWLIYSADTHVDNDSAANLQSHELAPRAEGNRL